MSEVIYLDHAATTPLCSAAKEAMKPYMEEKFGNPGGLYSYGTEAKKAVNGSRRKVATLLGAEPTEIFFTSGGTEADNWAILGTLMPLLRDRIQAGSTEMGGEPLHVITTAFEHHAVLACMHWLEKWGVKVTYLQPNEEGFVTPKQLEAAICPHTVLVSVMLVNNEIGTIQQIRELAKVAHSHGICFHTDGVQALGHIPVSAADLQVDLLSASGHKFGGPKGVGFLYVKQGISLEAYLHGGGQERGRRAGTENVAGIVGMAAALTDAVLKPENRAEREKKTETEKRADVEKMAETEIEGGKRNAVSELRNTFWKLLQEKVDQVALNGSLENRVPGNLNVLFRGVDSEALLLHLNREGICASGGSACTSAAADASHVLLAIGRSEEEARQSIRFSLGEENTLEEIEYVVDRLAELVKKLRAQRG